MVPYRLLAMKNSRWVLSGLLFVANLLKRDTFACSILGLELVGLDAQDLNENREVAEYASRSRVKTIKRRRPSFSQKATVLVRMKSLLASQMSMIEQRKARTVTPRLSVYTASNSRAPCSPLITGPRLAKVSSPKKLPGSPAHWAGRVGTDRRSPKKFWVTTN